MTPHRRLKRERERDRTTGQRARVPGGPRPKPWGLPSPGERQGEEGDAPPPSPVLGQENASPEKKGGGGAKLDRWYRVGVSPE